MNKDFLKRLFKHHKKSVEKVSDGFLSEIFSNPSDVKFLYDSTWDMNTKECCKSKDGTCATIECPHNYKRYGDGFYEYFREITKE